MIHGLLCASFRGRNDGVRLLIVASTVRCPRPARQHKPNQRPTWRRRRLRQTQAVKRSRRPRRPSGEQPQPKEPWVTQSLPKTISIALQAAGYSAQVLSGLCSMRYLVGALPPFSPNEKSSFSPFPHPPRNRPSSNPRPPSCFCFGLAPSPELPSPELFRSPVLSSSLRA
ncbi:hypothetical protein BJX76DRAFT_184433 [Aspergillus varians]